MRTILAIVFVHIVELTFAQNWAVFNKNYRYNFSLENEGYTTVVIFADSVSVNGNDTTFSLNRIAARCDSCFFYYPEAGVDDTNYVMINQPQFMQRRIVYSNNVYRLSDTGNYSIPRFSITGDSWMFNASRNITAQVISSTLKTYFGVTDSVKTILLSTNDTILISKQFGILKYPAKFGQHIYYKLRGIENKNSYDILSLYGEKVPNYFDFFKLKPGVVHYYSTTRTWSGSNAQCYRYLYGKKTITSSTLSGTVITNSFIDEQRGCDGTCQIGMWGMCVISNPSTFPYQPINTHTMVNGPNFTNFYNDEIYNSYNNKFYTPGGGISAFYVLKFGKTINNHFFKTYGESCFSSHIQNNPIPNFQYSMVYYPSSQNSMVYYGKPDESSPFMLFGETFMEGYGQVNVFFPGFESTDYYCTSAIIDGTDTLGDMNVTNVATSLKNTEKTHSSFGPNPTKDMVTIDFPLEAGNNSTLEMRDVFGKLIFQKTISAVSVSEKIDLQNLASGLYFIDVKMPHFQKQYKVIKQ